MFAFTISDNLEKMPIGKTPVNNVHQHICRIRASPFNNAKMLITIPNVLLHPRVRSASEVAYGEICQIMVET
jgi:hypothetical protein